MKKNSPMAQTTHLVSFGPVFVVSAHPIAYFVFKNIYILYNISSYSKKRRKNKKNTHLGPKRRVWRRLGPFSLSLPNPSCI